MSNLMKTNHTNILLILKNQTVTLTNQHCWSPLNTIAKPGYQRLDPKPKLIQEQPFIHLHNVMKYCAWYIKEISSLCCTFGFENNERTK